MLTGLMLGQSNAVGRNSGGVSITETSGIEVWNNTSEFGANGTTFREPISGGAPFGALGENNMGPWFCHHVSQLAGEPIRLIVVARGATPIDDWLPTSDPGYDEIVAVLAAVSNAGYSVLPFDFLIWQGSESNDGDTRAAYRAKWDALIARLTASGYIDANTIILIAPIAKASAAHIDAEHQLIASQDARIGYVPKYTVATTDDGVHWTGNSQTILGTAAACVWRDMNGL